MEDLRKLLDYVYTDEEKDYLSYEDDGVKQDSHIFSSIKSLSTWEVRERKHPNVCDSNIEGTARSLFKTIMEYESDTFSATNMNLKPEEAMEITRNIIIEDIEVRAECDNLDGLMVGQELDRVRGEE